MAKKRNPVNSRDKFEKLPLETQKKINAEAQELIKGDKILTILRKHKGLTQTKLAELLGKSQGAVSNMENREDRLLSTLRKYSKALEGRLVLTISFPGEYPFHIEID